MSRRGLVLAGLMKLKQVCNHPRTSCATVRRCPAARASSRGPRSSSTRSSPKATRCCASRSSREWGGLLAPYFQRRFGVEVGWLHGGVPRAKRDDMVNRFQDLRRAAVLLVSLKAGGTGLNLTAASHVVHLDRWWNPAVEDQATDRAYRIGQQRTVLVHKLVSTGTVEERIDAMISAKRALAEQVVGSGEGWITELSTDELREVIALRADAVED